MHVELDGHLDGILSKAVLRGADVDTAVVAAHRRERQRVAADRLLAARHLALLG